MHLFSYLLELSKRIIIYLYGAIAGRKSFLPPDGSFPFIVADSVRFYADTPNTIIRYASQGKEGFFRECRRHLSSKEFLCELFNDYCKYVFVNEKSTECQDLLNAFLENSNKWRRFYRMGEGTAVYSRITKYRKTLDYRILGFRDGLPQWFYDQLLQLVQFSWGPLMEHRYCRFLGRGKYQTFNSSKSIVTKLIADQLGSGNLVPKTYYAKLEFDGKQRVGVVVEPAVGEDPVLLKRRLPFEEISPLLQKNLLSLWVLDLICYQKDHRPGNFFIGRQDGNCYSEVSAFDNDCPTTLFPSPSIMITTYTGIHSIFRKTGRCRVPYISQQLFNHLAEFDKDSLIKMVSGCCSRLESIMLLKRIRSVRDRIIKNRLCGNLTLLDEGEWTLDTMKKELDITEDTYLSFFFKHYVDFIS